MFRSFCGAIILVAAIAFGFPASAHADPVKCRSEIANASAKLLQTRLKALGRCEEAIVKGKLVSGTECSAEPKVQTAIDRAAAKMHAAIAKRCGGDDRTCGTGGDDVPLDQIGWDTRYCPDLGDSGCLAPITDCGTVADCLECVTAGAGDSVLSLGFDAIDLTSPPRSALKKCQTEIGKATTKYAGARARALQQCWFKVSEGTAAGPCPTPGDGRTAAKLAKLEAKLASSICKRCGGGDRGCDVDVGSTVSILGTGGSDDFTPAAIGFAPNCPDVAVAGGASCASPIRDLGDVVSCLACTADASVGCRDTLAVPWAESYPSTCTDVVFADHFEGDDGIAWPAPWVGIGSIETADLQSGTGRFRPTISHYSLARVYADFNEQDVDASFTFEFTDDESQGVGFFVRSNGGYLQQSSPHGQGYAVFVEKFRPDPDADVGIGIWYEEDGHEIPLQIDYGTISVEAGQRYRVRFRVHQSGPYETILRAKLWAESDAEPASWTITYTDANPILQNVSGGFALDNWSDHTDPNDPSSYIFVDDLEIRRLRNPLVGIGAVTPIQETFVFAEGPRWRADDGVLLFSDIGADTIYRLTPPATVEVFRTPSQGANGLATAVGGQLLAAEHTTRRISIADENDVVTTLVDTYQDLRFNSPNDIAVRADGTVYFTDPIYGLADPGDREIPFNGLFRVPPGGVAIAEWQGDAGSTGPNGVVLSPDQSVLYMADSEAGTVEAWDVGANGALSNQRNFAAGMTIPDGMAVDVAGNVYVATWGNTIEVFAPSGDRWGSIPTPGNATNCTFGGADLSTLYITTQNGLYSVAMTLPGTL